MEFCCTDDQPALQHLLCVQYPYSAQYYKHSGHAMAWKLSDWPLTMEAQVQSQASESEICDGESATGTGFAPSTSLFFCQYHSTNASHSFIHLPLIHHTP